MKLPDFEFLRLVFGARKKRQANSLRFGTALSGTSPTNRPEAPIPTVATAKAPPKRRQSVLSVVKNARQPKKSKNNTRAPIFVGDIDAISSGVPPTAGAIITGQLVFASLAGETPDGNYTKQAPRSLTPWYNVRSQRYLQVWVHNDLVTSARQRRFRFAVDAVLRFGRHTKGKCIIFNGFNAADHTYLNHYTFQDGRLLSVGEKLVPTNPSRYETEMRLIIDDLHNFVDTRLYWTAPLPMITYPGLNAVPPDVFAKVRPATLANGSRRQFNLKAMAPIAVCVAAVLVYAFCVGSQVLTYQHARRRATIEASALSAAAEPLNVLAARDVWLRAPNVMAAHTAAIEPLLMTIAMHNAWRVQDITVSAPAKDQSERKSRQQAATDAADPATTDLDLDLNVPATGAQPLDLAQPILSQLASAIGTDLHLVSGGWQQRHDVDGDRLVLHIQGSLPGSPPNSTANDPAKHAGAITGVRP